MSYRESILTKLNRLPNNVCDSLIYQLVLYSDKVTFTGNIVNVYATKRDYGIGKFTDLFNGRVLLKIVLIEGRIQIWLPSYCDEIIYNCNIDNRYIKHDNSIKLTDIFAMIYKNISDKLENYSLINIRESLLMIGIKPLENRRYYIIRIAHDDNTYCDTSIRLMQSFAILFENILYFRIKFDSESILKCFRGLTMSTQVSDDIACGIVYLKSSETMTHDDLSRFPSLKYVDIICDYDVSLCQRYRSLRINNTLVQGQSPYDTFLRSN